MVLFHVSLMASDVECLFMCLFSIHMPSLVKSLLSSNLLSIFSMGCSFLYCVLRVLYRF